MATHYSFWIFEFVELGFYVQQILLTHGNSHLNSLLQPQHESSENLTMVSVTFRQQIISAKPLQSFAQNEEDSADWWAAATQVGGAFDSRLICG